MKHSLLAFSFVLFAAAGLAQSVQPAQLFAFSCVGANQFTTCPNGGRPDRVIQASDGNFYGLAEVTQEGMSNPQGGSIYKIAPGGQFTLLHTFPAGKNNNYPKGDLPGFLAEGSDGNLYGTAIFGGTHNDGVLFRIGKTGTGFKVLHQFCSAANCTDGQFPVGVVAATDGNIYGTTSSGGPSSCGVSGGCGTFFTFNVAARSYSVLHSLSFVTDGAFPYGLFQASDGNFYGTDIGDNVNGAIFRVTTTGAFTRIAMLPELHLLEIGVTQGANGNLFGIFRIYGQTGDHLFEIGLDGSNFHKIADFPQNAVSNSRFVSASDGNLWGTTQSGGERHAGSVVQISPSSGAVLRTFSFDGNNGGFPWSLVQLKDGTFAGTAEGGGVVSNGTADGVVFTLNANLPAPAK